MIQVGSEAPDFELASTELHDNKPGKPIKLSDYRGKKNVVLAFYPLDFSPVCSGEVVCFREDFSQFQAANTEVLGLSVDSVWTHLAFAKAQGLTFPLLADFFPRGKVAESFGLYEADKGITSRATVIVDRAGKVAYAKNHGLGTARQNEEILAVLRTLG
jgi:peroxiredoxin